MSQSVKICLLVAGTVGWMALTAVNLRAQEGPAAKERISFLREAAIELKAVGARRLPSGLSGDEATQAKDFDDWLRVSAGRFASLADRWEEARSGSRELRKV